MRLIRNFLSGLTVLAVLAVLIFTFWMRDRYVVPVMTYHHVSDAASGRSLNNVTPWSFARQMKFLKKHHYHVISFDDLVDDLKKGRVFARDTVVIQFDDGYEDNYTNAFPVLKKHHLPAMEFLISDKVGTPGFLTWDQVREMDARGFKAGAHTRHHVYLPDVSPDVARDEIFGSKKIIEEHLGHAIDYFCYPSGGFTEEVKGAVQEAGFKAAVTTNRGQDRLNRDLFAFKRVRMKDGDNALILWAKLSGYYNFFRKTKDAY
ncbi:MAG: polysaccharide deacetylase family protein [Candidatus Omnitrophica bacterium]|nr:polysaccharide deacetylase family protein [Candidatus Omnitrophota bacterium]